MCQGMDESKMACKGAQTFTVHTGSGDMEECRACGGRVAWDLVNHPLFGFKVGCDHNQASRNCNGPEAWAREPATVPPPSAGPLGLEGSLG